MELTTPTPPPGLIFTIAGHRDEAIFAASRWAGVSSLVGFLGEAGVDPASFERILDFGCGCGRLLAGWEPILGKAKLYGVDIDPALVAFCRENIKFADTLVGPARPPLPFPDRHFDFMYAASVWTHLSREGAREWALEMARIIKPGGVIAVSFHGRWYERQLAEISQTAADGLQRDGFYVHQFGGIEGSNDWATFIKAHEVPNIFREFDLIWHRAGDEHPSTHFAAHQDVAILRRRDSIPSRLGRWTKGFLRARSSAAR